MVSPTLCGKLEWLGLAMHVRLVHLGVVLQVYVA
jgi:hypothetical protein